MVAPAVRRADFLMALAYATDLATGQSRDFALRSCVLAMRLAEAAGLDAQDRRNAYHQSLLRYIGCNADTHLMVSAFGDEIAMRQDLARANLGSHAELGEIFSVPSPATMRAQHLKNSPRPSSRALPRPWT